MWLANTRFNETSTDFREVRALGGRGYDLVLQLLQGVGGEFVVTPLLSSCNKRVHDAVSCKRVHP